MKQSIFVSLKKKTFSDFFDSLYLIKCYQQFKTFVVVLCPRYNTKSDMWAIGCVLYELLTLKRSFDASVGCFIYILYVHIFPELPVILKPILVTIWLCLQLFWHFHLLSFPWQNPLKLVWGIVQKEIDKETIDPIYSAEIKSLVCEFLSKVSINIVFIFVRLHHPHHHHHRALTCGKIHNTAGL